VAEGAQTRESFTLEALERDAPPARRAPPSDAVRPLRVVEDPPAHMRYTVNVTTNTDDSLARRRTMSIGVGEDLPPPRRTRTAERRRDAEALAEDLIIVADAVSGAFARRERERQRARRGWSPAYGPRRRAARG
jgi:hypothetical protein